MPRKPWKGRALKNVCARRQCQSGRFARRVWVHMRIAFWSVDRRNKWSHRWFHFRLSHFNGMAAGQTVASRCRCLGSSPSTGYIFFIDIDHADFRNLNLCELFNNSIRDDRVGWIVVTCKARNHTHVWNRIVPEIWFIRLLCHIQWQWELNIMALLIYTTDLWSNRTTWACNRERLFNQFGVRLIAPRKV